MNTNNDANHYLHLLVQYSTDGKEVIEHSSFMKRVQATDGFAIEPEDQFNIPEVGLNVYIQSKIPSRRYDAYSYIAIAETIIDKRLYDMTCNFLECNGWVGTNIFDEGDKNE